MRKVIYGGANTLDNYIATKDDSADWILHSKEANDMLRDYWKAMDTIIMGRRTYEIAMKAGMVGGDSNITTYICSRTLKEVKGKNTELIQDVVELVKRLKSQPGKDIWIMGGSMVAKSLFEEGLIDEVGVNIHPLLLGSGIPLFAEMKRKVNLELSRCQQLKNGCVILTYKVLH